MTGATGFLASNQGIMFTFIRPPEERKPIQEVAAEMMGKLNSIPGVFDVLAAVSGSGDQHGRDKPEPGPVRICRVRRQSGSGL